MSKQNGFTLVELLVTIAIIGILSSVVTVGLTSSRQKARDARRITDIKQIQLALELYGSSNGVYPTDIYDISPTGSGLASYMGNSMVPRDPIGSDPANKYKYSALTVGVGSTCAMYHLGATLETSGSSALNDDADASAGTACGVGGTVFAGTDPIYDVTP